MCVELSGQRDKEIGVGKITGVYGIKGWVKVFSYTDPVENILNYSPWILKKHGETQTATVIDGKLHGKSVIVLLDGIGVREQAEALAGADVFIRHAQLPDAQAGEYYWSDLIGLKVETVDGADLGTVESVLATGANDVLIVRGERDRAIPFLQGQTVKDINLDSGRIIVDWDPEF